jgi:hypothetical protein
MNWHHRSPRVYRFLDKRYVDEFFETGRLRLSSFAMFRKHADEQRLDSDEGTISILCRKDESSTDPLLIQALVGTDTYVLSACLVPSTEVMKDFKTDSALVIRDPVSFAQAIGAALPGFSYGFDGPCSYQSRRYVYGDLSRLNAPPEAWQAFDTEPSDPAYAARMDALIGAVARRDPYFLKHHDYMPQNEWRFVWVVEQVREDILYVSAPEARQFCEPWSNSTQFVAFDRNGPLPPLPE